jgi:hypothetical protein
MELESALSSVGFVFFILSNYMSSPNNFRILVYNLNSKSNDVRVG